MSLVTELALIAGRILSAVQDLVAEKNGTNATQIPCKRVWGPRSRGTNTKGVMWIGQSSTRTNHRFSHYCRFTAAIKWYISGVENITDMPKCRARSGSTDEREEIMNVLNVYILCKHTILACKQHCRNCKKKNSGGLSQFVDLKASFKSIPVTLLIMYLRHEGTDRIPRKRDKTFVFLE